VCLQRKPVMYLWSHLKPSEAMQPDQLSRLEKSWHVTAGNGMTIFLVTDELLLTPSGRYRSWTTLDWSMIKEFKGTSTGNPYQWWSKPWLPVDIPLNQSIDEGVCYSSDQILPLKSFEEQRTSMTLSKKILRTLSIFWFDTGQKLTDVGNHAIWIAPSFYLSHWLNPSSSPKKLGGLCPNCMIFSTC